MPHLSPQRSVPAPPLELGNVGDVPSVFSFGVLAAIVLATVGCQENNLGMAPLAQIPAVRELDMPPGQAVVAQGRLEPAGGIVPISAAPGDLIENILVSEGDPVEKDAPVVELASLAVRQAELAAAKARREEAASQIRIAQLTAKARLRAAQIGLRTAMLKREQTDLAQGQLEHADKEIAEARRVFEQLQLVSRDPNVATLIGKSTLNQKELEIQKAEQTRKMKVSEADAAKQTADLAIDAAQQEVAAAQEGVTAAEDPSRLAALDEQLKILELQMRTARLRSPITGRVVSIDASIGQPTGIAPILQLADVSKMICRAEVDVAALPRLKVGASAVVTSPALTEPLHGELISISQVVGSPRLPNPSPMARSDWRAAMVEIAISAEDVQRAGERISLQVDVAIAASEAGTQVAYKPISNGRSP